MDHKKTGLLIAQRRKELHLTQKDLADKLQISDRTVSKWERGAGFPDLSLVEPLADVLGLSVLELLHGEYQPEAQPEAEHSARETLRALREEFFVKLERFRFLTRLLSRLLLAAVVIFFLLHLVPVPHFVYSSKEISASKAVDLCPYALITAEEFQLMEAIMAAPEVIAHQAKGEVVDLDASVAEGYREGFLIDGAPVETLNILVFENSVSASCQTGEHYFLLSADKDGTYLKTAVDHSFLTRRTVENKNNTYFSTLTGRRDLLAPFFDP